MRDKDKRYGKRPYVYGIWFPANPHLPRLINFLSWTWRRKRRHYKGVNLYPETNTMDVLTSCPTYGDSSYTKAKVCPNWPQFHTVWPCLTPFGPLWLCVPKTKTFCIGIVSYMATLGAIFSVNLHSWSCKITLWFTLLFKKYKIWTRDVHLRN